jgi:hypothetical protein
MTDILLAVAVLLSLLNAAAALIVYLEFTNLKRQWTEFRHVLDRAAAAPPAVRDDLLTRGLSQLAQPSPPTPEDDQPDPSHTPTTWQAWG